MKPFAIVVLALSMALNATFAILLLVDRISEKPISAVTAAPRAPSEKARAIDAEAWSGLESPNLRTMVARLQDEGFPPALVQAILAAHINESFQARRKALVGTAEDGPFWADRLRDPHLQLALRQLSREQQQALRNALGREPDEGANASLYRHKNLAFLGEDKAAEVRRLLRDYDQKRSDLYMSGYNQMTDAEKMKVVDRDQAAALAALLTPAEFAEYNMRSSRTADTLREELSAFAPSEQEFRSIYGLRAAFDERFPPDNMVLMLSGDERSKAQKELIAQIKSVLGAERAAEYEKKTDYNYRRTSQLVARLDLPPNTADQIWAIQKEAEAQRRDLYSGRPNQAEMTEKLTGLQKQTIARITPLLGERAMESYYQYGGSWLQMLVPRARPAPPAATPVRQ
jgi:hypothetical protein